MNVMYDYEWMQIDGIVGNINRILGKPNYISVQYEDGEYIVCRGAEAWNECEDFKELFDYLVAMQDGIQIALEGRR